MNTVINFIKVVLLTLILIFTISTARTQYTFEKQTALELELVRKYSDNRAKQAQLQMLSLMSEISSTTVRLATLQCPKHSTDGFTDGFCDPRYNPYISKGTRQ
ncbi:hypothetical protein IRZ59_16030 [Pseudomonas guariconensis]|uniref:hypothetical protein n=1 Tax=Pseudomonas guariconensis TaxID=1288410 RepID=UPI0018A8A8CF|nr:hypothetical protein [Pseudomonas guariconensis]MBF8731946.1 hypothetical protein [Pseudomonas guariconensis]